LGALKVLEMLKFLEIIFLEEMFFVRENIECSKKNYLLK
jgi:hypothetical protein